jgi:hypothetical protein
MMPYKNTKYRTEIKPIGICIKMVQLHHISDVKIPMIANCPTSSRCRFIDMRSWGLETLEKTRQDHDLVQTLGTGIQREDIFTFAKERKIKDETHRR